MPRFPLNSSARHYHVFLFPINFLNMHIDGSITMTPELNTARGKKKINKQLKKKTPFFFTENKTLPLF
jgi:hypothetical protein